MSRSGIHFSVKKVALKASPLHRADGLGSRRLQFHFEIICGCRKNTIPLVKCYDNYSFLSCFKDWKDHKYAHTHAEMNSLKYVFYGCKHCSLTLFMGSHVTSDLLHRKLPRKYILFLNKPQLQPQLQLWLML